MNRARFFLAGVVSAVVTLSLLAGCGSAFRTDLERARDLYENGSPREAREIALVLAGKPPEDTGDAIDLADLLTRVGEGPRAAELLKDRDLPAEGRDVLADAWLAAGDRTRADLVVKRTFDDGNATPRTWLIRGKLDLSYRNLTAAAESLRESLARDDDDPYAWAFLAFVQAEAGDAERAERGLRQARARFPASPEVALALATVILRQRATDPAGMQEAADLLGPAVAKRPLDYGSRRTLARLLRDLDRLPDAEAVLEALVGEGDEDPATWTQLGLVRMARGRIPDAVAAFRRAVEKLPRDLEMVLNLGQGLLALSDYEHDREPAAREAETVYDRAMRVAPSDPRVYVGLARASIKIDPASNEQASRARQLYLRALQFDADSFEANLGLAVLYYDLWANLGQEKGEGHRKALAHFDRAAAVVPSEQWEPSAQSAYRELRQK